MVNYVLYALVGILGGLLGGMGMGGGTILIPLLGLFFSIEQHTCQVINLLSFIPMALISLIIHFKNKLIDFKGIYFIIIFGLLSSFVGSYIAKNINGAVLKKVFGGFLIILSIYQFITGIKSKSEN